MEKRNIILKRVLAIICLITLVLPSFSNVMAVSLFGARATNAETAKFGISFLNKNGWGYRIKDRLTYRIYQINGSNKSYDIDIYCLDYTKKFPAEDSNSNNFTTSGDLTTAIKNRERLRLIAENMYLTTMTEKEKDESLARIFAALIERTSKDANKVTLEYIKSKINEDDIFFAQQSAIWKYTNDLPWQGTSIWLANKENPADNEWYQISNIGQARYEFMKEIYSYFTGDTLVSESNNTNPSLIKNTKTSEEVEDGYIVGPFYIKSGTNKNYTVVLKDQTGAEISKDTIQANSYRLVDKDGNRLTTKLENTLDKEFYVKLPLKTSITKVTLELNYNSYKTTTKLWTNGELGSQPLMEVEREVVPGSDRDDAPLSKPEKIYDLALRKYIVQVGNTEINDRNPKIVYNQDAKEINYLHKKEPVELEAGDTVIYNITVYNEGNQPGIARNVKDYLPEGLEFVKGSQTNTKYGWIASQDGSYVISTYTKNYELAPFDETTGSISSVTLQVECKVKEDVTEGILTNVAEITEDNIEDIDSEPNSMNNLNRKELPNYKGKDSNKNDLNDSDYYYRGQQDDDDFEKVKIKVEEPEIVLDFALRKYITSVNGNNEPYKNREPEVDVKDLANGRSQTAKYTHSKEPVQVKQGDVVIYSIRVYNEGEVSGYVNEITDYIPEGLGFLVNHEINYANDWKISDSQNATTIKLNSIPNAMENLSQSAFVNEGRLEDVDVIKGKVSVTTRKLQYGNKENLIEKFDSSKSKPDSKVVQIACIVVDDTNINNNLRNIAAITGEVDSDGIERRDRDSYPTDVDTNNYPDRSIEDDDDYEKLVLVNKKYDLALKKFLSEVNGNEIQPCRLEKVETAPLQNGENDAKYTMDKSIVKVVKGQNVVYTIRVYNEGEVDSYAEEVKDNIPDGLEFVQNSSINNTYKWTVQNGVVKTNYLSKAVNPDKVIKAFNKTTGEISYQEVKIEFKVVSKEAKVIKNIAEITADDGDDRDSIPDNNKEDEDDQDYDNIIPGIYDLALQKFITKIDNKDITSREPVLTTDADGKILYARPKDPLTVVNNSVITYTIRVYNEGTVEAFVEEIKDNIPEGLVFLADNEINQKYGWKLYDENGNETDSIETAVEIRTDYLSKAKSAERGENNRLKPYDKALGITDENPDHRDVQVVFKVDQNKMGSLATKIKNIAEISKDDGDDVDSDPDNDDPNEDDIDDEEVEVKYFDLALLKYVTKVIVNEDGVVKETKTGHTGLENPEPVVKVELNRKKLNKTTVTFVYDIKITNEGQIAGYAKEIKDRIPDGLAFYADDNKQYGWKVVEEGIVTTDYLKDKLLQPGESATVEIRLRWVNNEKNLGTKINTAEISKDENEYGTPDIDSTPDNNKDGEDDQDTAPVVLSIVTGAAQTYIVLTISVMTILSIGFYTIKKFVL